MTKSDLIRKIYEEHTSLVDMPLEDSQHAVNLILEFLSDCLADGQRIEIRGFGTLYTKLIPGKLGHNPKTGETVDVPPKLVPRFKAGTKMREMVDTGKVV